MILKAAIGSPGTYMSAFTLYLSLLLGYSIPLEQHSICLKNEFHIPHAIESLDVEPGPSGRLAVLRANADIEVWSLQQGEDRYLPISSTAGSTRPNCMN